MLAAAWAAITGAGVQAGQSPKTGTGRGPSLLDWLCSLAPPVFLVGLLTVLSLVTSAALNAVAGPVSPPSEAASKQEGIAAAFNAASFGYLRNNPGHPYPWRVLWLSLGITISLFATFAYFVDVNLFSLHALYANRLIRTFLGASRPKRQWTERWKKHKRKVETGAPTNACDPLRDADPVTDFDDQDDIRSGRPADWQSPQEQGQVRQ